MGGGRRCRSQVVPGPNSPTGIKVSRSETQVQTESVVDSAHDGWRYAADPRVETFDGDSADLFRLSLRVTRQTAGPSRQPDLKRVYPAHIAGDRHDGHDASSQACRALIGAVVARDYCGSPVCRLGAGREAEIHQPDVAPTYRFR